VIPALKVAAYYVDRPFPIGPNQRHLHHLVFDAESPLIPSVAGSSDETFLAEPG
jgi:hypothetical protein